MEVQTAVQAEVPQLIRIKPKKKTKKIARICGRGRGRPRIYRKFIPNSAFELRVAKLIEANIQFAKRLVEKFYFNIPRSGLKKDDLLSAAMWGLCNAARNYNFDLKNCDLFRLYAKARIIGAMLDTVRNEASIANRYYSALRAENGGTDSLIDQKPLPYTYLRSRKDIDRIDSMLEWMNLSVDVGRVHDDIELIYYYQYAPEENTLAEEQGMAWGCVLEKLSDRERELVEMHYFDGYHLEEIRQNYGVSKATISRWHSGALDRLKKVLRRNTDLFNLISDEGVS